ncbi:MAG: hypothetical protein ACXAC7_13870, partial [Candidatus Hodarchaeales archaeon]
VTEGYDSLSGDLGFLILYLLMLGAIWGRHRSLTLQEKVNYEKIIIIFFASWVASYSHAVDFLIVFFGTTTYDKLLEYKTSMWRPHNFWHTPLFSLLATIIITIIIFYGMELLAKKTKDENLRFRTPLFMLIVVFWIGYLIHILGDTLTYDFDIYYFWPFHDYGASLYDFANDGFTVICPPENPDCFVYYWAMPVYAWITFFMAALIKFASKRSYRLEFENHA